LEVSADEQDRHHSEYSKPDFNQGQGVDDDEVDENLKVKDVFVGDG
jgi:hypothetical protein